MAPTVDPDAVHDVAVVELGLIGSAAVRHLVEAGASVVPALYAGLGDPMFQDVDLVPPTTYPDGSVRLKLGPPAGTGSLAADDLRPRRGSDPPTGPVT